MTASANATERFHALDALRAAMMFLGIYLHAVVAYSPNGGWPWRQAELTRTLDWSISIIHVFRMPIFYAMAGFFTALLIARYGFRRAAWNRFMRIGVPFVVGWLVTWPLVMLFAGIGYVGLERTLRGFASGYVFNYAGPMHLWFLEYLILLYILAALAVAVVPLVLSQGARQALLQAFRRIMLSPWAPLALAVPSFAAQLLMPNPWIEDPPGFMPVFRIVAVYAIPFAFGWLLFLNADLLAVLIRRAWLYAVLAVVASVAYRYSYFLPLDRETRFYLIRAVHAVTEWLLILRVAGLFLRYLAGHSAYRRYLCDSSYFLYIAHMPVILAFQLLLEPVALPPLAKIVIALVGTIAILMPDLPIRRPADFYRRRAERPALLADHSACAKTRSSSGGSPRCPIRYSLIQRPTSTASGNGCTAPRTSRSSSKWARSPRPTCRPGSRATIR